jgi:O-antigen/teichoic acid export membrane protein
MKSKEILRLPIWVLSAILVVNMVCNMVNLPDTLMNILGVLLLILFIVVTVNTECFLKLKLKKNKCSIKKSKKK